MRYTTLSAVGLVALAVGLVLCGCPQQASDQAAPEQALPQAGIEPGPKPKPVRIGLVSNAVSPFWNAVAKGLDDASSKLPGCEASWQGPQTARVTEQRRLIENYVAQGVDGLAVSPLEAAAIGPVLDGLVDKGLKVICIDSDIPGSKRLAYVGTNNIKAGQAIGEKLVEILEGKPAKVVAFVGTMSVENARDRLEGFKQAVKGHSIEVLDVKQDNADKNKARRNVEDTLQAMPEANVLLGLWSYNLPAIAAAVNESDRKGKITVVGFDADPATLEGLKRGEIHATVVQRPYYFGYLAVMLLYNMTHCGVEATQKLLPQPDMVIDTGVEVVTPETFEDFSRRLQELGLEST